jgi:hypothetical protein
MNGLIVLVKSSTFIGQTPIFGVCPSKELIYRHIYFIYYLYIIYLYNIMPKTSRKTKKNRVVHDVTFQGLNEWYKRKFEKLGWMILAKRDGYMDKVMAYENSIKRLHTAIGQKIEDIHDKDTRADLYIMKENVEVLLEHAKTL